MHIENIEKDTDSGAAAFFYHGDNFTVRRRHRHGTDGNRTLGIAKEPRAERRQKKERDRGGGTQQPGNQNAGCRKSQRVVDAVADHYEFPFYMECAAARKTQSPAKILSKKLRVSRRICFITASTVPCRSAGGAHRCTSSVITAICEGFVGSRPSAWPVATRMP